MVTLRLVLGLSCVGVLLCWFGLWLDCDLFVVC